MASTTFWPCETRTSTCRSFATISSGLYRFLAITVLLDVKDIPQVGPLQWGWINLHRCSATSILPLPLLWSILHRVFCGIRPTEPTCEMRCQPFAPLIQTLVLKGSGWVD